MFAKFLDEHAEIQEELEKELFQLEEGKTYEIAVSDDTLLVSFLDLCKQFGFSERQYPLNLNTRGESGLRRAIKKWKEERIDRTIELYADENSVRKLGSWQFDPKYAFAAYQRWEFDGHKIDYHWVIVFRLPDGRIMVKTTKRIWLLVVRDCGTGAIVGHHLVLKSEYNSEDVLTCLENAIVPWRRRELTIEGLEYSSSGGMPGGSIPALAYAYPNELAFDNARAHGRKIDSWVWARIKSELGCQLNPGPVGKPDQRLIEGFFKILTNNSFLRIPGTTGNSTHDPRKKKNAEAKAKALRITADEIEELVDVLLANLNGELCDTTPGHSPLERLAFHFGEGQNSLVRQVDDSERLNFCLAIKVYSRPVRGRLEAGRRPHVHVLGVDYTSPKLCQSPSLYKKRLIIHVKTRDLRSVRAYLPDGTEFGQLIATGGWSLTPHDIKMREMILALRRERRLKLHRGRDPIKALLAYLDKKARSEKRLRNHLAHAERVAKKGAVKPTEPKAQPKAGPIMPRLPKLSSDRKFKGRLL